MHNSTSRLEGMETLNWKHNNQQFAEGKCILKLGASLSSEEYQPGPSKINLYSVSDVCYLFVMRDTDV